MELDQGKIINCVPVRILHSVQNHFGNDIVSQWNCARQSVSKFGIDTTKNRWYRIGIVSI